MANINQLVNKIEQELNNLISAQTQIEIIKDSNQEIISGFKKIHNNLDNYLKNYQSLVHNVQLLDNNVSSIKFPEQFDKLNSVLTKSVLNIESAVDELKFSVEVFINNIQNTNFSQQFNNLNATIKTTTVSVDKAKVDIINSVNSLLNDLKQIDFKQKFYLIEQDNKHTNNLISRQLDVINDNHIVVLQTIKNTQKEIENANNTISNITIFLKNELSKLDNNNNIVYKELNEKITELKTINKNMVILFIVNTIIVITLLILQFLK
ncbi:MAG TPA: hypothetical protein PKH93_02405 [Chitinophagales bacterium]|nr:hypothetical protein [Chitinophagales bacterium]